MWMSQSFIWIIFIPGNKLVGRGVTSWYQMPAPKYFGGSSLWMVVLVFMAGEENALQIDSWMCLNDTVTM